MGIFWRRHRAKFPWCEQGISSSPDDSCTPKKAGLGTRVWKRASVHQRVPRGPVLRAPGVGPGGGVLGSPPFPPNTVARRGERASPLGCAPFPSRVGISAVVHPPRGQSREKGSGGRYQLLPRSRPTDAKITRWGLRCVSSSQSAGFSSWNIFCCCCCFGLRVLFCFGTF